MAPIPEQAPHCVMTMRGGNQKGLDMCGAECLHALCMLHLGTVSKQQVHLTPVIGNKQYNLVYKPLMIFLMKSPCDVHRGLDY